jgi:ribosomal protein S18 acetylase RimI-like enzyme
VLRPAHIGHLALLRSLIRDAARDGAFDPALAWDSPAASRFFGELRQALKTGYFVVEDQASGTVHTVAVPGYVYWADETAGSEPPVGFGLFRAVDDGYELWLTGIEAQLRGKGHGRAMLQALFSTPTGRRTKVMRVRRSARSAGAVAHLLAEHGFTATRETDRETWFVRVAPPPTSERRSAPLPSRPLH